MSFSGEGGKFPPPLILSILVGARLESLEKEVKDIGVKFSEYMAHPKSQMENVKIPDIVVTELPKRSFADIAAARTGTLKNTDIRQRSDSQKRGINDDDVFTEVKKKTRIQGKTGKGTFIVKTVTEENYQTFVSNVAPQIKNLEMTETIGNCYEEYIRDKNDAEPLTLKEIEVQDMTPTEIINPRRRCWRVSIPYRLKKVFEDENFYPSTWRFRQFFPARTNYNKKLKSTVGVESMLTGGN